ncbi:MAG TPA: RodZ domain-containing protein [bacterium]|nr:RodZ domain-containing protein [bacterium]
MGIGERLRSARTARGLTFDDIEAETRIKGHYLDALEREAWDELPGATYVRGFLASYARQLGISVDEILGLYPSGRVSSVPVPRPVEVRLTPGNPQSRLRRIVTATAVVFVAGAVVLGYVLVGQLRQFAATRPRPETTNPPQPARAMPGVTPTSGGQPAGAAPATPGSTAGQTVTGTTPAGVVPPTGGQPIVVTAQATDRSWVRVVSDGSVVYEGFLSAGDHQVWQGQHQVSVRVGNASALDLSVNGQSVGRLGNPGDVVDRTFSSGGPGAASPATPAAPPATAPATTPAAPPATAPAGPPAPVRPAPAPAAPPGAPTVTPTTPPANQHP